MNIRMTLCSLIAVAALGCGAGTNGRDEITRTPGAEADPHARPAQAEPIGTADGGATSTPPAVPIPSSSAAMQGDGVPRITVSEARQAAESGRAVIVDVRSEQSFAESRIPGAINIPLDQFSQRIGELPEGRQVITYCT